MYLNYNERNAKMQGQSCGGEFLDEAWFPHLVFSSTFN